MIAPFWVVYDHPKEHLKGFLARKFEDGEPTDTVLKAATLEEVRKNFNGMQCSPRAPDDGKKVVETWA